MLSDKREVVPIRTVGLYKEKDIAVKSFYVEWPYDDCYGVGRVFNLDILKGIDITVPQIFPRNPYYVANPGNLDHNLCFPPQLVYAHLTCSAPIIVGAGSTLVLIWFQPDGEDVFDRAAKHLRKVEWEKWAVDILI